MTMPSPSSAFGPSYRLALDTIYATQSDADNSPPVGSGSSSITPGVPWANIEALVEGLKYYRRAGR